MPKLKSHFYQGAFSFVIRERQMDRQTDTQGSAYEFQDPGSWSTGYVHHLSLSPHKIKSLDALQQLTFTFIVSPNFCLYQHIGEKPTEDRNKEGGWAIDIFSPRLVVQIQPSLAVTQSCSLRGLCKRSLTTSVYFTVDHIIKSHPHNQNLLPLPLCSLRGCVYTGFGASLSPLLQCNSTQANTCRSTPVGWFQVFLGLCHLTLVRPGQQQPVAHLHQGTQR